MGAVNDMERMMYQPTAKQEAKWGALTVPQMPTDEEFKTRWAAKHKGKTTGWGMAKRDWVLNFLKNTREYQMGLWQGRVDNVRGLDYSEERNDNTYNLGYYRGYEGGTQGMDEATRTAFLAQYGAEVLA